MTLSPDHIRQLLKTPEDGSKEFKQITFSDNHPREPPRKVLADEIAAFANSDGGLLICSVTDQHEVQGMTQEQGAALEKA